MIVKSKSFELFKDYIFQNKEKQNMGISCERLEDILSMKRDLIIPKNKSISEDIIFQLTDKLQRNPVEERETYYVYKKEDYDDFCDKYVFVEFKEEKINE